MASSTRAWAEQAFSSTRLDLARKLWAMAWLCSVRAWLSFSLANKICGPFNWYWNANGNGKLLKLKRMLILELIMLSSLLKGAGGGRQCTWVCGALADSVWRCVLGFNFIFRVCFVLFSLLFSALLRVGARQPQNAIWPSKLYVKFCERLQEQRTADSGRWLANVISRACDVSFQRMLSHTQRWRLLGDKNFCRPIS